ncbi:hypothetical protein FACS1894166_02860 [Bacilli bacterium]|nr:hypothetical protein FACS1894166_02860 [Bacilli bacterium]
MNQSNCTIDHIFPKSMNGSSTIENLTLLSKESNLKKGNRITGNINGLQFEVRKIGKSKHGKKIGKLHIKK